MNSISLHSSFRLFGPAEDADYDKIVPVDIRDDTARTRWDRYVGAYRDATHVLVMGLLEGEVFSDQVFPILANARQCLELQLKYIYLKLNRKQEIEIKNLRINHNLHAFWDPIDQWLIAKQQGASNNIEHGYDFCSINQSIVREAVDEFMKYDPRADAFRFPEHQKHGRLLAGAGSFDVPAFRGKWLSLQETLDEIDGVVDNVGPSII